MVNKINKEVLINAAIAGLLMSGAVILKAALGDTITVNMDMNDISSQALEGNLVDIVCTDNDRLQGE